MTQRDPIYKGATYKFTVDITISDIPVDVRGDVVKVYLDKSEESDDPAIVSTGDVLTAGLNGKVYFELTPEDTAVPVGSYFFQVYWFPEAGGKYPVTNDKILVKKNVPKVIS